MVNKNLNSDTEVKLWAKQTNQRKPREKWTMKIREITCFMCLDHAVAIKSGIKKKDGEVVINSSFLIVVVNILNWTKHSEILSF